METRQHPDRRTLYDEIVKNGFDELTLLHLENEIKLIENGERTFGRYDFEGSEADDTKLPELFEGISRGGSALAEAALVCRADETAGTPSPRGVYETEKEIAPRQERLLQAWAEARDCWYDLSNLDESLLIGSGGESEVYRYDEETVMKVNTTKYTVSPQLLIDRMAIHNTLFPETAMNLVGFGRNGWGEFCFIYTQPFVQACGQQPTPEEIEDFLKQMTRKAGTIERYTCAMGSNYRTPYFLLDDFHDQNVIRGRNGRLKVIDSDIRFNTPGMNLGGKLVIPPVEKDFMADKQKQGTTMAQQKEKDNGENRVVIEGPVYSCNIKKNDEGIEAFMEVYTASRHQQDDEVTYTNRMYHRVVARASGAKASRLERVAEDCRRNIEGWGSEGFVPKRNDIRIKGQIDTYGGSVCIKAADEDIKFPTKSVMQNSIALSGKVVECTHNDAYATAIISVPSAEKGSTLIPVHIYKEHNPKKWDEISSGRLAPGTQISTSGVLSSKTYSGADPAKKIFVCSVNATGYNTLEQKKEKGKKTTTQLGF